jgi:hypothetical protein
MAGLSNNAKVANFYEQELLEIEEIFSLYFKCLNDRGWDNYLVNTLGLNTNKFSEFLKKEEEDDNRGVNTEYEKLLKFLKDSVFEKFEEKVPSQFSKKEVLKLLLCAIFQSNIEEIDKDNHQFLYDKIKSELNTYIHELKKSMEELEPVQEVNDGGDETKDEDDEPIDGQSSKLNDRLTRSTEHYKELMKENNFDLKEQMVNLLSRVIDVEGEIVRNKLWKRGRHRGFLVSDDSPNNFLNSMQQVLNVEKSGVIIKLENILLKEEPSKTRSRKEVDQETKLRDQVETLYNNTENRGVFKAFENSVFAQAKMYIINLLNELIRLLDNQPHPPFIEMIEQLNKAQFVPLNIFNRQIGVSVYTTSYKVTVVRKVVEILSEAFQSAGFLISEKIVKLIKNMRGSDEVLDIKQDPLILRFLYKSYLYVSSSVRVMGVEKQQAEAEDDGKIEQEQQSLSELICEKYQINEDFRDIIKDKGGNDEEKKMKMAIAFAFNNNIYF